jgi:hypothetical protein
MSAPLLEALAATGGASASREHAARLRALATSALAHGERELALTRSGYRQPVLVVFAAGRHSLLAACPAAAVLRADSHAVPERAWLVVAAVVGALVGAMNLAPAAQSGDLRLGAGRFERWLALSLPAADDQVDDGAELATLGFDERLDGVDRLRARAALVPAHVLETVADVRAPIGPTHPLRIAEAVARLGGDPISEQSVDAHEDAVLALLQPAADVVRAHDDADPVRRIARRILQRLDGMGKWGGYHTEFAHLSRGFAQDQRALASQVGERLLAAGLLVEKISVGQRHVFLNPRRSGDVRRLVARGEMPAGLTLPPMRR